MYKWYSIFQVDKEIPSLLAPGFLRHSGGFTIEISLCLHNDRSCKGGGGCGGVAVSSTNHHLSPAELAVPFFQARKSILSSANINQMFIPIRPDSARRKRRNFLLNTVYYISQTNERACYR